MEDRDILHQKYAYMQDCMSEIMQGEEGTLGGNMKTLTNGGYGTNLNSLQPINSRAVLAAESLAKSDGKPSAIGHDLDKAAASNEP